MRKILFLVITLLLSVSCSNEPDLRSLINDNVDYSTDLAENQRYMAQLSRYKEFAFNLMDCMMADHRNENFVIAPLSVSMAMSMTANGADGETYTEICRTLGFDGLTMDEVNSLNHTLIERLQAADNMTQLAIANSMWLQDGSVSASDNFIDDITASYGATVGIADMRSMYGVSVINRWISDKTGGKIGVILDEPIENALITLVNTTYFKSVWATPFSVNNTKSRPFRNETGETVYVSMMKSCHYQGLEYDGATVVKLPFGNRSFSFVAVLPPEGKKLEEYVSSINASDWLEWRKSFIGMDHDVLDVDITIPKFSTTSGFDLISVLESLGIKEAFTHKADLSKLTDLPEAHIVKALQKTIIEVDEEGIVGTSSSSSPAAPGGSAGAFADKDVVFDRPYFYIISEESTGTILFMGNVSHLDNQLL